MPGITSAFDPGSATTAACEVPVDRAALIAGQCDGAIAAMIARRGIAVLRGVFASRQDVLRLGARLGALVHDGGRTSLPGGRADAEATMDATINPVTADFRNTYFWQNDGILHDGAFPVSMIAAPLDPAGLTLSEFCDLAAAWQALAADEQAQLEGLTVIHAHWRDQLYHAEAPDSVSLAQWMAERTGELPLVRTGPDGARMLVLGHSALQVSGTAFAESEQFLANLTDWVTQAEFTRRHRWATGDLVVWDSHRMMYRALPRRADAAPTTRPGLAPGAPPLP